MIEEDGFLSPDAYGAIKLMREGYARWFSLCEKLNKALMHLIGSCEIKEVRQAFGCAICVAAVRASQTTILLLERGLVPEARMHTRFALEAVIAMAVVDQDFVGFLSLFGGDDQRTRAVAISKLLASPNLVDHLSDERKAELKAFLAAAPAKQPKVVYEQLAKDVGLADLYTVIYRSTSSDSSHITLRSVENYLIEKDGSLVPEFGPSDELALEAFTNHMTVGCHAGLAMAQLMGDLTSAQIFEDLIKEHSKLGALEKANKA